MMKIDIALDSATPVNLDVLQNVAQLIHRVPSGMRQPFKSHAAKGVAGVFYCQALRRKVTTGITGLCQPSVHSDVAF